MIVELESKLMPELFKSYKVLHHDEYPIVFYGKNFEGGNIIGSFIFEDEETDTLLFFVCEVTKNTLLEFLRKNIPYRYVMTDATKISIVTTDYFYHIENKKMIQYTDIEADMLPSHDSFCPVDVQGYIDGYIIPPPNMLSAAEP